MRNLGVIRIIICLSSVALLGGCYTTSVYTTATASEELYEDQQWFLLAGAVDLSDPAGDQCSEGVAWLESEYSAVDILIEVGLGAVGSFGGYYACDGIESEEGRHSCRSGFTGLLPFIFGSRTVNYRCAVDGEELP